MDISKDLEKVNSELTDISTEIEALLERQQFLLTRKLRLETLSVHENAGSASATETDTTNWSAPDFPWSVELEKTREKLFKISRFRPLQLECINVTMSGRDCVLIMPTGGGKSLCFQLPAVISKGITLVVSPLVSLMEDQLMALKELNIKSAMLNASCSKEQVNSVQSAMVDKNSDLKLLYVTPEKISKSKRFMAKLEKTFQGKVYYDVTNGCLHFGNSLPVSTVSVSLCLSSCLSVYLCLCLSQFVTPEPHSALTSLSSS